ncbi:MAG: 2-C-methyl-D-erythritol 2,4-cyclodiphosphate synthase [Clostridia bacterium]|nr:2-C-methyl-D-erythritol 2,4-cyclodiphosphate synthase [Clostridia bacterium]
MRIGHGYDVHRLKEGERLILAGVEIPHEKGLEGYSDADVLLHALMDAILGAAALGDIGLMFPDNDPQFFGADSTVLLAQVVERVAKLGYRVSNLDCTIIAQKPKLAPYIPEMEQRISDVIGIAVTDVNVKATTEEKLGFTGSEQGIAAHAVVLLAP